MSLLPPALPSSPDVRDQADVVLRVSEVVRASVNVNRNWLTEVVRLGGSHKSLHVLVVGAVRDFAGV